VAREDARGMVLQLTEESMGSDLWFREFERLLNEKEASGKSFDQAYTEATSETDVAVRERLADMADRARKRERGE